MLSKYERDVKSRGVFLNRRSQPMAGLRLAPQRIPGLQQLRGLLGKVGQDAVGAGALEAGQ